MADLTYNIATMQLKGSLDGIVINSIAHSGGRGGTKTIGAENLLLANNPFGTSHKLNNNDPGDSGGALPIGIYYLQNHEKKDNWIRLNPDKNNVMYDRDGFAIHGRGKRGSDGCIVPTDFSVVQTIYRLVAKRYNDKNPPFTLKVEAIGDMDYFLRIMRIV